MDTCFRVAEFKWLADSWRCVGAAVSRCTGQVLIYNVYERRSVFYGWSQFDRAAVCAAGVAFVYANAAVLRRIRSGSMTPHELMTLYERTSNEGISIEMRS